MAVEVSGFTFLRNGVKFDYPFVESIRSILPLVDEFVVNVGPCEDGTVARLREIGDPRIRIVESAWNPHLPVQGFVYAQQTNIALFQCTGRWAVYIQTDEVLHEDDLPVLREAMGRHRDDPRIDALSLEELTFWGDYDTVLRVFPWRLRPRVWVVKPHHFVVSRGDASGFSVLPKFKERGRLPRYVRTPARLFHYSTVKSRGTLAEKVRHRSAYNERSAARYDKLQGEADLYTVVPRRFVERFRGTHPALMRERIARHDFRIDLDSPRWRRRLTWKERRRLWKTHVLAWRQRRPREIAGDAAR